MSKTVKQAWAIPMPGAFIQFRFQLNQPDEHAYSESPPGYICDRNMVTLVARHQAITTYAIENAIDQRPFSGSAIQTMLKFCLWQFKRSSATNIKPMGIDV